MRSWLYIAIITSVAVLGFAVVYPYFKQSGAVPTASGGPASLAGAPAASFPLQRLDGQTDALSNYRGHVVLVNLWASWCEPCRTESPALERLYRENKARGFVVLGIDQGEDPRAAGEFARSMHLSYPILLDKDQQYGNAYSGLGLPTTLLVTKDGRVAWGHDGELSFEQLSEAVRPLVGA